MTPNDRPTRPPDPRERKGHRCRRLLTRKSLRQCHSNARWPNGAGTAEAAPSCVAAALNFSRRSIAQMADEAKCRLPAILGLERIPLRKRRRPTAACVWSPYRGWILQVIAWIALPILAGTGFGVGVLSGFFGIGGGFLIVPGLVSATSMPLLMRSVRRSFQSPPSARRRLSATRSPALWTGL
jgi:hypothetical protein